MKLEELKKILTELDDIQAEANKRLDGLNKRIAELKEQDDEKLKAQGEEKPEPPHPRWKPERDEHYYTIDIGGACAGWETWDSDNLDGDIYSLGLVFKTEAEAEFAIECLKVLAEMREWAGEWRNVYTLAWDNIHHKIITHASLVYQGELCFATKEDAENCIKAVGADRIKKYYFMIPEDENNE